MPNCLPGSPSRAPIPDRKDSDASPTFVHPHPRHGGRRLSRATSANHPVYLDHQLHVVHNDDHSPADHYGTPHDDDRSRTRGANVSPTTGPDARGDRMPRTDRGSHPQVLGPVRSLHGRVGDLDRMARIELSARRSQPDRLLRDLPNGTALARRPVRWRRVPGLVLRAIRCGSEHRGRRFALCVLGIITLATLIGQVR